MNHWWPPNTEKLSRLDNMSFNVIDCFVFRNISLSWYHVGSTGYATYLTLASVCTRCIFINWRLKVGSSLGMVAFWGCKTKIAMLPSAGNNWCREMQKEQNKNTTVNAWKRVWSLGFLWQEAGLITALIMITLIETTPKDSPAYLLSKYKVN